MIKRLFSKKALLTVMAVFCITAFSSCKKDEPLSGNFVNIDGVKKEIVEVTVYKPNLIEDRYNLSLLISPYESIGIETDKEHYENKVIDLTKKDPSEEIYRWYYYLEYNIFHNDDWEVPFCSFGEEGDDTVCFSSGTLRVTRMEDSPAGNPCFEIELRNGRITDNVYGDGVEHTISLHYKGSTTFND